VIVVDVVEALRLATSEFGRRLAEVAPDGWDAPSPCTEWTVKDLCDHLVGGNRFAVLVVSGVDWREALTTVQGGDFSGEPQVSFDSTGAGQIAVFEADGALARTVSHPNGPMSGQDLARHRVLDLVVHGWDVARASSGDERIDPELAEIALQVLSATGPAPSRDAGFFGVGPSGAVGPETPIQLRLLDLSGRRP
jgi:uncharacterized protein (TIGR03086 family)